MDDVPMRSAWYAAVWTGSPDHLDPSFSAGRSRHQKLSGYEGGVPPLHPTPVPSAPKYPPLEVITHNNTRPIVGRFAGRHWADPVAVSGHLSWPRPGRSQ